MERVDQSVASRAATEGETVATHANMKATHRELSEEFKQVSLEIRKSIRQFKIHVGAWMIALTLLNIGLMALLTFW